MSPTSKGWQGPRKRTTDAAPLADVVEGLLGQRPFAEGETLGRLARRWPEVVGDRLAAETAPARLESGILTVSATSGAWGAQARFLAEEILREANRTIGRGEIRAVHVVVRERSP